MIKHYTLENKPSFKDGDKVLVDMDVMGAESLGLMKGKIVGKVSDYIIDYWIVDFSESLKTISEDKHFSNYPFSVLSVLHTAFVIQ